MNTLAEMRRDLDRLRFVKQQIKEIEKTRAERLAKVSDERRHVAARALTRVVGVGVETADMLVQEVFSREIRDRRALARYAGLTGLQTRAAKEDASEASPKQATPACAAG